MVIGKTFAWAHMPKTAGDMTLRLFHMFPQLLVHADPRNTNDKHARFRDRNPEIKGKSLLLNIRRLPSWMLSYAHHKARRGLYPEYTPLSMDSPYQMAYSDMADRTLHAYTDGGRYTIDRWLRAERIVDDFLVFAESLIEIDVEQMKRIEGTEPVNTNSYDKELDHWFTPRLVEQMYARNPTWAAIEAQVYGNLVTLG